MKDRSKQVRRCHPHRKWIFLLKLCGIKIKIKINKPWIKTEQKLLFVEADWIFNQQFLRFQSHRLHGAIVSHTPPLHQACWFHSRKEILSMSISLFYLKKKKKRGSEKDNMTYFVNGPFCRLIFFRFSSDRHSTFCFKSLISEKEKVSKLKFKKVN